MTEEKGDKGYVKEVAIAGIVILESIALMKGIDGAMLGLALSVIGGIVGYSVRIGINHTRKRG